MASIFEAAIGLLSQEFVPVDSDASLQWNLKPPPTRAEIDARNETLDVYICDIEARSGELLQKTLKQIPGRDDVNILHVRRFAKPSTLPIALRSPQTPGSTSDDTSEASTQTANIVTAILAPKTLITLNDLFKLLVPLELTVNGQPLRIRTAKVPAHAPTSLEHAEVLTRDLWPTIFTNSNPFGPHPTMVASNQGQLSKNAGKWMTVANQLGSAAQEANKGIGIGVLFVEPISKIEEAVAGAGDSRLCHGGVARHAVLRALDLLARKRRRLAKCDGQETSKTFSMMQDASDYDPTLTSLEQRILAKDNLKPGGYLALNLDVYVTHEPCVMCCMALVHSRVGRCIFGNWMPLTGGFGCAVDRVDHVRDENTPTHVTQGLSEASHRPEPSQSQPLGYGLFWRQDLNWRFLAWHFSTTKSNFFAPLPEDTHA